MKINSSLFAHINNDAYLTGTSGLQGRHFFETISYLKKYLDHLKTAQDSFPNEYDALLNNLNYLVEVESWLKLPSQTPSIDNYSRSIALKISQLNPNERIFLPGGWCGKIKDSSHALIYEFKRLSQDDYHFTVINAGDGAQYHGIKSRLDKELYNPTKIWKINANLLQQRLQALQHFIARLLIAMLPNHPDYGTTAMTGKKLYEEVLPNISFLDAKEQDANQLVSEDFYTGGQLSGTCAQRSLHQMLKISSPNLATYKRFILGFKLFSFFDYLHEWETNNQPITPDVIMQMNWALDNNIKILNTPNLFTFEEKNNYEKEFVKIKHKIQQFNERIPVEKTPPEEHSVVCPSLKLPTGNLIFEFSKPPGSNAFLQRRKDRFKPFLEAGDLLSWLDYNIPKIETIYQLEQTILTLYPIIESGQELNPIRFNKQLSQLIAIVSKLNKAGPKTAVLRIIALYLMSLLADTREKIDRADNKPSFQKFTDSILATFIINQIRNPLYATNHPVFDSIFKSLHQRFAAKPLITNYREYYDYLNAVLIHADKSEFERLNDSYNKQYGQEKNAFHTKIRINRLQALYFLEKHKINAMLVPCVIVCLASVYTILRINGCRFSNSPEMLFTHDVLTATLFSSSMFFLLHEKLNLNKPYAFKQHLDYEEDLTLVSNIFLQTPRREQAQFFFAEGQSSENYPPLYSCLGPLSVMWDRQNSDLADNKYGLNSVLSSAFEDDIANKAPHYGMLLAHSANYIQLNRPKSEKLLPHDETIGVQNELITRDYRILRCVPTFQIALSIDYLSRHLDSLADGSVKLYFEANLFQPGLLLDALKNPHFMPQWKRFVKDGLRHFKVDSQHHKEWLFFLRQDYLVSRYWALSKLDGSEQGLQRLQANQIKIEQYLATSSNLSKDIRYVLNQYLFLNLVTQIELGCDSSVIFLATFNAYFYIRTQINPHILEDATHRAQVDVAIQAFQKFMLNQPSSFLEDAVKLVFQHAALVCLSPGRYQFINQVGELVVADVILGRLFNKNTALAYTATPLALQHHPLLHQLGYADVLQCQSSDNETYLILSINSETIYLTHCNSQLTVQKKFAWSSNKRYQLQPLTLDHLAYHANKSIDVESNNLPMILKDGSMNYWAGIGLSNLFDGEGILTRDNIPVYEQYNSKLYCLNSDGSRNGAYLTNVPSTVIDSFEGRQFILAHQQTANLIEIILPRFALRFEYDTQSKTLIELAHHERVVSCPSPIAPSVAGLVLQSSQHKRLIVRVNRFYVTKPSTDPCAFFPVYHDINSKIDEDCLAEDYKRNPPQQKGLWYYENNERCVSFHLDESGRPHAKNAADGLYLAYLYLVTNQTQLAWNTLDECKIQWGGLKGHPDELLFITWIFQSTPYRFNADDDDHSIRDTPHYVSCRLKALSLLCDYLLKGTLYSTPCATTTKGGANERYAGIQAENCAEFQRGLGRTISLTFDRYLKMSRHTEYGYQLNISEKKHLLDYAKHVDSGILSPSLQALSLDFSVITLEKERIALKNQDNRGAKINLAQKKRWDALNRRFKALNPVLAIKSTIEPIYLEVKLPKKTLQSNYSNNNLFAMQYEKAVLEQAITELNLSIKESLFVTNFPMYLCIAYSEYPELRAQLEAFCRHAITTSWYKDCETPNELSNFSLLNRILYLVIKDHYAFKYHIKQKENPYWNYFYQVVSILRTQSIYINQMKPARQNVLCSAKQIQEKYKNQLVSAKIQLEAPLESVFDFDFSPLINTLITQYRAMEESSATQIERLTRQMPSVFLEQEAGQCLFAKARNQTQLALYLMYVSIKQGLIDTIRQEQTKLVSLIQEAWKRAVDLANRGPDDPELNQRWRHQRLAKSRALLNKADLLLIYSQADFAYSVEQTGLSEGDCKALHHFIHAALIHGIRNNTLNKIDTLLQRTEDNLDAESVLDVLNYLAYQEIPGQSEPAVMIMQHEEALLLRPYQDTVIKRLLQPQGAKPFQDIMEKITMGGGKSKVILPILAQCKASGNNLVIFEVPESLLATNYVDLNTISARLFKKNPYLFEHNRASNHSVEALMQIYQDFNEVMVSRRYVITTGDSILSLEMQYVDLCLQEESDEKSCVEKLYWLEQILSLLRNYGDGLIDEAHQGLSILKKLNYVSGQSKSISPTLIKLASELFRQIEAQWIHEAPKFSANYCWDEFQETLARKLVCENNPTSPLAVFARNSRQNIGEFADKSIIDYLTNRIASIPSFIQNAAHQDKEALAYCKYQITTLLPHTLTCILDVNYGASRKSNLTAIERTLAIPYSASNTPNERSQFGNALEAINFCIQMMYIKGVDKELITQVIKSYQALALNELMQDNLKSFDQTPQAIGFYHLTGISLKDVDLTNNEQMSIVQSKLRYNQSIMHQVLEEHCLPLIRQDRVILHGDSFNHVDCYRTLQSVSGTPSNHTTVHQRIQYNANASIGSDGYILEVIKEKQTAITALDYDDLLSYLKALFNGQSPQDTRVRAIIDVNASFKENTNLEVAEAIIACVRDDERFSQIKHVLYFNAEQVLSALVVDNPDIMLTLGSSDENELARLLESSPDERFTFYDQAHTLGVDIQQGISSHAWVFTDEKTNIDAFLQGCMRMRGLCINQTIALIVPTRIADISLESLFTHQYTNQQNKLIESNFFAAQGCMVNLVRNNLFTRLLYSSSDNPVAKRQLANQFRAFFVSEPNFELFSTVGQINKSQSTQEILQQYADQLMKNWSEIIQSAGLSMVQDDKKWMEGNFKRILENAFKNCPKTVHSSVNMASVEVELELENKIEVQKEIYNQIQTIQSNYSQGLRERGVISWNNYQIGKSPLASVGLLFNEFVNELEASPLLSSLISRLPGGMQPAQSNLFTPTLSASHNYLKVYSNQKSNEIIGFFLKPVFLIHYYFDASNTLHAMLITPQDGDELIAKINASNSAWISTTQDSLIAGQRPDAVLSCKDYQALREQVQFFNGEFDSLLKLGANLIWLRENPVKKLSFYEKYLMPWRLTCLDAYQQIKTTLLQMNQIGFEYISTNPFENYANKNWQELDSEITELEMLEYQRFAEIVIIINAKWRQAERLPSISELQTMYNMPMVVIGYVQKHIAKLNQLSEVIPKLTAQLTSRTLVEKNALEWFLNLDKGALSSVGSQDFIYINTGLLVKIYEKKSLLSPSLNTLIFTHLEQMAKTNNRVDCIELFVEFSNPVFKDLVIKRIQSKNHPLSWEIVRVLAAFCQDNTTAGRILAYPDCNDEILRTLVVHPYLSEAVLIKMVLTSPSSDIIDSIISVHFPTKRRLISCLLNYSRLSSEQIFRVLRTVDYALSFDELQTLLKHPAISEAILAKITDYTVSSNLLDEIIQHDYATQEVYQAAINNRHLSMASANYLLQKHPDSIDLSDLCQLAKAIHQRLIMSPSQPWLLFLGELFSYARELSTQDSLVELMQYAKNGPNGDEFKTYLDSLAQTTGSISTLQQLYKEDSSVYTRLLEHPAMSTTLLEQLAATATQTYELEQIIHHSKVDLSIYKSIIRNNTAPISMTIAECLISSDFTDTSDLLNLATKIGRFARTNPEEGCMLLSQLFKQAVILQSEIGMIGIMDYVVRNSHEYSSEFKHYLSRITNNSSFNELQDTLLTNWVDNEDKISLFVLHPEGALEQIIELFEKTANIEIIKKLVQYKLPDFNIDELMHLISVLVTNYSETNEGKFSWELCLKEIVDCTPNPLMLWIDALKTYKNLNAALTPIFDAHLLEIATHTNSLEELIAIGFNQSLAIEQKISERVLTDLNLIATRQQRLELLRSVIDNTTNDSLLMYFANRVECLPEMTNHLLGRIEALNEGETSWLYYEILFIKVYEQYHQSHDDAIKKAHWIDILERVWPKIYNNPSCIPLIIRLKQENNTPFPPLDAYIFNSAEHRAQLLPYLSIENLIREANVDELALLTQLELPLEAPYFLQLSQRVNTKTGISTLLNRSEITADSVSELLAKNEYDGFINPQWPADWINEGQIKRILDKANDYSNVQCALRHANFSHLTKKAWLSELRDKVFQGAQIAPRTKIAKIKCALAKLKLKSAELAVTALDKPHYNQAAQVSFDLHQQLQRHLNDYLESENPEKFIIFRENCIASITPAMTELKKHRGIKQDLLDVINVILVLLSFGAFTGDWRFFKAKTNSEQIVDECSDLLTLDV